MSDEPWKFFAYTAVNEIHEKLHIKIDSACNLNNNQVQILFIYMTSMR